MADCELIDNCAFFQVKMANMPSTARLMRGAYCTGNFIDCARFIVYNHGKEIPLELYPNENNRAAELIR